MPFPRSLLARLEDAELSDNGGIRELRTVSESDSHNSDATHRLSVHRLKEVKSVVNPDEQ